MSEKIFELNDEKYKLVKTFNGEPPCIYCVFANSESGCGSAPCTYGHHFVAMKATVKKIKTKNAELKIVKIHGRSYRIARSDGNCWTLGEKRKRHCTFLKGTPACCGVNCVNKSGTVCYIKMKGT